MRRATFLKTLVTAATIGFPRLLLALTGRVLPNNTVSPKATLGDFGWLAIQFDHATPPLHWATTWRAITGTGPTPPLPVEPRGSTRSYRRIRVGEYGVIFQKGPGNTHVIPPGMAIPKARVVKNQVTIHYITYS